MSRLAARRAVSAKIAELAAQETAHRFDMPIDQARAIIRAHIRRHPIRWAKRIAAVAGHPAGQEEGA